jgi:hypothetical protein
MAVKKNPTTVHLTKKADAIRQKEAPIWGLKQVLSAGLILFDKLSAKEQKRAVAEANAVDVDAPNRQPLREAIETIKRSIQAKGREPGTIVTILSRTDQARLDELRRLLGSSAEAAVQDEAAAQSGCAKKKRSRSRRAEVAG